MTSEENEETRPGPKPERLNLDEGDWHEAVRKVLKHKKPPEDEAPEGHQDEDSENEGDAE